MVFPVLSVPGTIRTVPKSLSIEGEGEIPRRLTPRECARLQGFPDTFKIVVSDTQAYKQFGNSVVVPLMTAVAEIVVKKVEELDNEILEEE